MTWGPLGVKHHQFGLAANFPCRPISVTQATSTQIRSLPDMRHCHAALLSLASERLSQRNDAAWWFAALTADIWREFQHCRCE
ncbi:hypothetical protein R8871_03243 [Paraburkholderia graminis C4D1M]|jgi:hypothetical protein|nr:hypothetical protein R8871_03243 [Paraburkholderia graminis C4D1M]